MNFLTFALKVIFIALGLSGISYAHDQLSELIDKCDFKKFKETYEKTHLSEEQKAELLKKVDLTINEKHKKIKAFFGATPHLKEGKIARFLKFTSLGVSIIFLGFQVIPILGIYDIHQKKLSTKNSFNRTAASFVGNSIVHFARYQNKAQRAVNSHNKDYLLIALLASIFFMASGIYGGLYKWAQISLITYKQWKKSLKIKKLIEDSMAEFIKS